MFSEKDFERLWFLYKTEGEPNGVSINSFCIGNNIPYTAFYDWFKKTQKKSRQLDEIGKDLKESNRKIDSLTNALLKANSKVEKAAIEYKLRDKEYKKLEKKYNALLERLSTAE